MRGRSGRTGPCCQTRLLLMIGPTTTVLLPMTPSLLSPHIHNIMTSVTFSMTTLVFFIVRRHCWSRFKLSVSAGSQKRTIYEPEGRNESRFSLKSERNIKTSADTVEAPKHCTSTMLLCARIAMT